ncbi:unnamed protein product [Leptidea sinapis]|uniref:Uncharacterized protein n=1 Tax=Leptidea sinapis TaxID=189913 RepID=A0A5E4QCJ9_9NEOP|nr:unnamed protein product [Leptidea sinapis]
MVKFGKNKLKLLNKLAKKQNAIPHGDNSNKILKKKINAEKKVSFQKEVLLKEAVKSDLVTQVEKIDLRKILYAKAENVQSESNDKPKPKSKPVEKKKKRQKIQRSDTQLLLSLMKKKS